MLQRKLKGEESVEDIHFAEISDAVSIAKLQVRVWRKVYEPFVSRDALLSVSEVKKALFWQEWISEGIRFIRSVV